MIKNIIFDFGDIFINLDKEAIEKEFFKIGIKEFSNEVMFVFSQYEMGLISTESFTGFFSNKYDVSSEKITNAWNAILLDFPMNRLRFIKELANNSNYRLFLLSNTNELHISWIKKNWGTSLFNEFKNCFEKFYLSHEIKMRKPNRNIYEYVLNENDLNVLQTLFIDDTKENTEAAKYLGFNIWNLVPGKEDITNLFNQKYFLN